jgi:hypothetical protein
VSAAQYLIWSNERRAWWRENRGGYTTRLAEAGFYTREEALSICTDAHGGWRLDEPPPEIMVLGVDAHEVLATALAKKAGVVGQMFRNIVGGMQ